MSKYKKLKNILLQLPKNMLKYIKGSSFMKKIFISSILFFLSTVSLSAKEHYIQVMSISDSSYLKSVENNINKIGYKTYINKRGKWYIIYAGPFKNSKKANKALSRIKKSISKDAFLTKITASAPKKVIKKQTISAKKKTVVLPVQKKETKRVAEQVQQKEIISVQKKPVVKQEKALVSPVKIEEKKEIVKKILPEETISVQSKKDKGFYIGLAAGLSMIDVQQSGSEPVILKLEDSGINYSPEMGYYFNNNVFISINYQNTDLEDVSLSSAFATLNYQLDEIYSISPYIGAIVGYSTRTWEKNPVTTILSEIDTTSSLLGGLQVGSEISLYDGLSLYLYYRYLIMDTTTIIYDITPGEKKIIEHGNEQNLNMGIKYNF